jgi:hypothetical protein
MKRPDFWENIILLLSAILLVPIWALKTNGLQLTEGMFRVYQILQAALVIALATILVRRVRRVIAAMRENKDRHGP